MRQQTGAGNDWSEMVEKHDGQCCVLSSRLKPVPRKRCRDIMLGLLSAAPSVGSVIWRSGMNGAGGIPFSREVGMSLSLDEARAVVRGAETGEMGTAEGRLVLFSRDMGMQTFPHPAKTESVRIGIKRLPQSMRPELSDCCTSHPRLTRLLGPARARQR